MADPMLTNELCAYRDWDSNFFQRRIARLLPTRLEPGMLDKALDWCLSQNIDCLYFLASGDHPTSAILAGDYGFSLVDTRVTLIYQSNLNELAATAADGRSAVRSYLPEDLPTLMKIAAHSFTQTRFYNDKHFDPIQAEALYRAWVEASCQDDSAKVLVALLKGEPAGFISLHNNSDNQQGSIGLLSVSEGARCRGLGTQLVNAGLEWFAKQRIVEVSVVTQGANLAALHLYQRRNFAITSIDLWFHKWFARSS